MAATPESQQSYRKRAGRLAHLMLDGFRLQFKYPLINVASGIATTVASEAVLRTAQVEHHDSIALTLGIAATAVSAIITTPIATERFNHARSHPSDLRPLASKIRNTITSIDRLQKFMLFTS